jgi:selenide,water dikinase
MPIPGPTAGGVPAATDIVLLGAGAAHLEVLRRFALRPQRGVRLTLLTPDAETPHPGRLAALVRGDCPSREACIDLALLAGAAGARLILAEPTGLDLAARTVELAGRPPLPFDLLSADLSGESAVPEPPAACIAFSPVGRYLAQLPALEAALPDDARIAVVGGAGASDPAKVTQARAVDQTIAVEQALALARRFGGRVRVVLVTEAAEPLAAAPSRARRAVRSALVEAGVELASAVRAGALAAGRLTLSDGSYLAADVALWTGGMLGPGFLADSGLACDAAGRVRVNRGQRSVSHPWLFAAGDCAAPPYHAPTGRLLFANLRRAARGRRLTSGARRWGLPSVVAGMLDLGGGQAVAWCHRLALTGTPVWRCKGWLDRRRMRRYVPPIVSPFLAWAHRPTARMEADPAGDRPMAGAGVAATTPGSWALMPSPDALVGLGTPDHAAVLTPPAGQALVQSVSSLRVCLDDPFVFGQIAAAHALSQHHATGARPWTALAVVLVPAGALASTAPQSDAEAMLAGVSDTLFTDGCTLVGARRTAASEGSVGLALTGLAEPSRLLRKSALRPGDVLLLTKPLGSGIVLAAHRRGAARGEWLRSAIDAMRTSNAEAACLLRAHGATACAGIAERGLAGHLTDMLHAAGMAAALWPERVPALPGALELAAAGGGGEAALWNALALPGGAADPRAVLLADPQVSGGLLAALPPARADACLAALHRAGSRAVIVGVVEAAAPDAPAIRLARAPATDVGPVAASPGAAAAVLAQSHA